MTVPDPILERYRLGELSEAERRAVEADLTPADRARLAELDADSADILERYPPRVMAIAIERKRAAGRRRWVLPTIGSAVVLLGAAAALTLALQPGALTTASLDEGLGGETVRAKGHTRVVVYSQADPTTPLQDGARVSHGQTVQLGVAVEDQVHGVLISIDGRGVVTTHWPLDSAQAAPIDAGRTQVLPQAYTLDDAPAFERFLLVTGPEPFPVADVVRAGHELARHEQVDQAELDLPDALTVTDHLVRKVSP